MPPPMTSRRRYEMSRHARAAADDFDASRDAAAAAV